MHTMTSPVNYLFLLLPLGNLYIADSSNHRIRKIAASSSTISTVAGTGTASYSGDNVQATSAALYMPYGVVVDSSGEYNSPILLRPSHR